MADWIEKRFDKIDEKLDKVDEKLEKVETKVETRLDKLDSRLDVMTNIQVSQAKDIAHHIARTDALQNALTPISKNHQQLIGILKFIAFLVTLSGLFKLVEYLKL